MFKSWTQGRVKVTCSKHMVPSEKSSHKENRNEQSCKMTSGNFFQSNINVIQKEVEL